MAFLEYALLALLGSTGVVAPGGVPAGSPAPRTLDNGSFAQTGGAVSDGNFSSEGEWLAQCTGGDKYKTGTTNTGRKTRLAARRHHRSGHRHGKIHPDTKGKKG